MSNLFIAVISVTVVIIISIITTLIYMSHKHKKENGKIKDSIRQISSNQENSSNKIKCLTSNACSNRTKVNNINDVVNSSTKKIGRLDNDLSNLGVIIEGKLKDFKHKMTYIVKHVDNKFRRARKTNYNG
jgi:hypothetical protein